jgi:hypothetical protein
MAISKQVATNYQTAVSSEKRVLDNQKYYYGTTPKQAVAEQNQTYIAYFDGVGGTGPEYIDGTGYFIKYLIDTNGNVVNPEPTDTPDSPQAVALYNLLNNFEPGKRAVVKLIEPNPLYDTIPNSEILTGIHNIASVGRIVPIAVTETGQNKSDYILTMSFLTPPPPGGPSIADVSGFFQLNTSFSASKANAQIITWQDEVYGDYYTFGGDTITITTSSFGAGTRIKLKVSLGISTPTLGYTFDSIKLTINRNTSVPGDNVIADSGYIPIEVATMDNPKIYTVETGWIDASVNDVYRAFYDLNGSGTGNSNRIIVGTDDDSPDSYFLITQETAPYSPDSGSTYINGINSIYASPGLDDSYCNVVDYPDQNYSLLTWNSSAREIFNSGLTQTIDPLSLTMGFSEIKIPFGDVKPGDFIRFEYNKNQNYTIVEVNPNLSYTINVPIIGPVTFGPYLTFKVTPNVGTILGPNASIQKGHFVIYRVINDGTYVTLDVKKDAPGGAYSGILQPEFISQELIDKYDKIITDLTSKEVIN